MEAWRQWRLGRRKNLVQRKNKRIYLTPTGLLMEGHSAQNPCQRILSAMGIYRQPTQNKPFPSARPTRPTASACRTSSECERYGTDIQIRKGYGCVVSLGMLQVFRPGARTRENSTEKSEAQSHPSGIWIAARRDLSEDSMKKIFLLMVVPALLVAMGFAQTPAASATTDQVNITGCLGGTDGNYSVAEGNTGKTFKITSSSVDLKAFSGQEVRLSGQNGAAENSLAVTEVNMISEHCATSAAAPAATISTTPEALGTPPTAAEPAAAPAALVSSPVKSVGAPAADAAAHRTGPSAQPQKAVAKPAAAPTPAKPVSTPVAGATTPTATGDPSQEADSTATVPAAKPSWRGSTLMLVGIVVVLLLLGIAVPIYNRSRKQKLLDQAGGENLSFTHSASSDPGLSDKTEGRKAA